MTAITEPSTAEQCMALMTDWARDYPCARFTVVAVAPDGSDAIALGWGLALPEHAFCHLPEIRFTGQFRTADRVLDLLRPTLDARIIWIDPEPAPCGD